MKITLVRYVSEKFVGMQIEFLLEYYMISNYVFVLYFSVHFRMS